MSQIVARAGALPLDKGVFSVMTIMKGKLVAACVSGFLMIAGGSSAFALGQEAPKEPAETAAATETPKTKNESRSDAELFRLVGPFLEQLRREGAELEALGRKTDASNFAILEKLLELAAPKDNWADLDAARARLEKLKRAGAEMDDHQRDYNEKLESMLKNMNELAEQLKRASGKAKPEAQNRPHWLPADRPVVVSSDDGRVLTVFPLPWWLPDGNGKATDAMKTLQTAKSAPQSVRLAEADSPRLKVLPRFHRRPSGRFAIAPAVRGEKVQRLAVFDPEIWRGDGFSGIESRWVVQDLHEPVTEATPVAGKDVLACVLGRRIYTYRFASGKWDVLELPEGARPDPPAEGFDGLVLEYQGIVYSYNKPTGEWVEIDTRVVPDAAKPKE